MSKWFCVDCSREFTTWPHKCSASESIGSDCSTDEQSGPERSGDLTRSAERQALAHFLAAIKRIDQQEVDADYKIGHIIAIGEEMQRCLSENRG